MGGPGSGNRWRYPTKGICEKHKRIDIRYLRKHGLLDPPIRCTLLWNQGGENSGCIDLRAHAMSLELNYRYREGDQDDWQSFNEHISFSFKDQPFGGVRKFFICPGCKRRCMVLYGGAHFRCRKCHDLAYASQNEDQIDRIRRKAEKIRGQLGGELDLDWSFPKKPKGMHWRTYYRLRSMGQSLEDEFHEKLEHQLERLSHLF